MIKHINQLETIVKNNSTLLEKKNNEIEELIKQLNIIQKESNPINNMNVITKEIK